MREVSEARQIAGTANRSANQTPEARQRARERARLVPIPHVSCWHCQFTADINHFYRIEGMRKIKDEPAPVECRSTAACERRIVASWPREVAEAYLRARLVA